MCLYSHLVFDKLLRQLDGEKKPTETIFEEGQILPGKSHGRRSLVGSRPWGREESGTTEQLHFHFSLSCIGEGNGNPLQCSYLENPRNGGAWWAAVYGVAQSWLRLKQLMKRQNDRILKEELPGSVGAQYATGDQWRNNSRKNEGIEPKQKQYPAVDVTGDRRKV